MAEATTAVWRRALEHAASALPPPISTERCLAALHYAPWTPPVAARPSPAATVARPNGALTYVARAALSLRHTLAGRLLYRLTPKPLVDALRERL